MAEEIERCANTGFGVEFLEHLHRYRLAQAYCAGKVVLDAACGTGYGSAILAETAAEVHGIDIAEDAIELCRKSYPAKNISFQVASVEALPFPDRFFDVIVSFETIEHVPEAVQRKFLAEIQRLLKPEGVLVISSPDKQYYTIERNKVNPYHLAEFFRKDFFALLEGSFKYCQKADQKIYLCSLVKAENAGNAEGLQVFSSFRKESGEPAITDRPVRNFWYNIAVASRVPVAPLPDSVNLDIEGRIVSPDGKTEQEAYIEKLGGHIRELDEERAALIAEREEHLAAIGKYQEHVRELDAEREEHLAAIGKYQEHVKELDAERASLVAERGEHLAAIGKYQERVKELDAERASLVAERKEHLEAIERYQAHIRALDAERDSLVEEREEHLAAIGKYQEHVRELDADKEFLLSERETQVAYIDRCHKHIASLDAVENDLRARLAALEGAHGALQQSAEREHETLERTRSELAALRQDAERERETLERTRAELAQKSGEAAELRAELDRTRDQRWFRLLRKLRLLS